MRFESAEIDRYGPLKGCRPPCDDGITVVAGPNESGKTLYLEGVLQLLDPDVVDHMDPGPRVDEAPTGRVVVNDGSEQHALGDGIGLNDVSRIDPAHLYNLFVVRDSDLALPEGPDYYTSLVEHLGDIHTSVIEAVRGELVSEGRLTPTNLNLANREYDTRDARKDAADLADDIDDYLEDVEEQGIRETVRERLQARKALADVESSLETQRTAGELADFEDASARLAEYVEASDVVGELAGFDRDTLDGLRDLKQDLEHARERSEDLEASLARKREEAERRRAELSAARDRHAALRQRERDVDAVRETLASYRDAASDRASEGFESRLALRRYVAVAALTGGGVAVGGGAVAGSAPALAVGLVLLLVAAAAWYAHRRFADQVDDVATLERDLLEAARDAGFDVDAPEDVAPLLREFENDLERAAEGVNDLDARYEQLASRVEELEDDLEAAGSEAEDLQGRLHAVLDDRDVDSLDEYDSRLEEKERHLRRRSNAEPVLERALGDPDSDDPSEKIAYWGSELDEWQEDLGETDVDAGQYDEDELEGLEERQAELEAELDTLEAELDDYHERLDGFERRANELSAPPFVETDPSLEARTDAGLEDLADDLRDLVYAIERNAEISAKAIGILDDVRDDEEQKVATLFDPDGPASEILANLTDGRYTAVDYDPETEALAVTREDGRELEPRRLSRGTQDQLYFAARLSLAEQLLDGGAGFLLLDDPFLAADRTRLRNGFETLQGLSEDGWQVVYLTAKPEVHDEMAAEFGCPVHELELLEF